MSYPFLFHLPGWLLFLAFPLLFMNGQTEGSSMGDPFLSWYYWQFCLFYIFLFYFHAYLLFPRLFLKRKYVAYAGTVVAILIGLYWLHPFGQLLRYHSGFGTSRQGNPPSSRIAPTPPPNFGSPSEPGPPMRPFEQRPSNREPGRMEPSSRRRGPSAGGPFDITSFFICFIVMSLSAAFATTQQWRVTEQRAVQAEADKAQAEADRSQAELSFLKAQINPHFLFNTLNNLYSLAVIGHEKTAESILKLSKIMRYVTDQTGYAVSLEKESESLRDYVDLQRLRMVEPERVVFSVEGPLKNKSIAPLVLMTFVENAFKYGVSSIQPTPITIRLSTDEHSISFFCQNRMYAPPRDTERTGIGLSNTRKRLAQLYPDVYQLIISKENGLFTVQLILPITVRGEGSAQTDRDAWDDPED
jgi:two-component system, LytTR family, sensor kinase